MEVADLDEFYPTEIYEDELLLQKIYSLGRYQTAVTEKLEGEFIRPRRQVTAWMNFFSREIKDILSTERRLYDENSEESLELLRSVIQQLKTMKKYIADHMEPTLIDSDSDSVSDSTQKSSIPLAEEEDSSVDCKLIPSFLFEETEYSTSVDSKFFFPKVILNFHKALNGDGECCSIILNSSRYIFDRGKKIELSSGNSWFPKFYSEFESKFDVHLKILDGYYRELVQELIHKHGYWSDSLYSDPIACTLVEGGVSSTAWQVFGKMLHMDVVNFKGKIVIKHQLFSKKLSYLSLNLTGSVFDRGKGIELMGRFDYQSQFQFMYLIVCMLALKGDSGVGFSRYLKRAYMPFTELSSQVNRFLHSVGDFRGFHDCSFMAILTNFRRCIGLLRMGLFLHCQPPALVLCEALTNLERVEMVYANPSVFDLTFEENSDNSKHFIELFLLHNKLLCKDCVGLRHDGTRSLFDRGKCTVIPSLTDETLLLQLLLSLQHDSELQSVHLFSHLCVGDFAIHGVKKMFVQITERGRFVLFLLDILINLELDNQLMFYMVNKSGAMGTTDVDSVVQVIISMPLLVTEKALGIFLNVPDSAAWSFIDGGDCYYGLDKEIFTFTNKLSTQVSKIFKASGDLFLFQVYTSILMLTSAKSYFKILKVSFSFHYRGPIYVFGGTHLIPGKVVHVFLSLVRTGPCYFYYAEHDYLYCYQLGGLQCLPKTSHHSTNFVLIVGTQVLLVIQILDVILWFEYLKWKFRSVPPRLWSIAGGDVFTWVFTELLDEPRSIVVVLGCCSGWEEFHVMGLGLLVQNDTCSMLDLKDQGWRNQALLCHYASIEVKLLVLVKRRLVLTSGAHLTCVLLLVVTGGVVDQHCPTADKCKIGAGRDTLSTTYLREISTRGSGLLVNLKRRTTTLGYHYFTRNNSQLFIELGVEVFSFEAEYLLMVIPISPVLAWLDYLRWKFKWVSVVISRVVQFCLGNVDCKTARDKVGGPGVMQADIMNNLMVVTVFCTRFYHAAPMVINMAVAEIHGHTGIGYEMTTRSFSTKMNAFTFTFLMIFTQVIRVYIEAIAQANIAVSWGYASVRAFHTGDYRDSGPVYFWKSNTGDLILPVLAALKDSLFAFQGGRDIIYELCTS